MINPITAVKRFAVRTLTKKITLPMFLQPWTYSYNAPLTTDFDAQTKEFRSWVYICATKNAAAVAKIPLRLYAYKTSKKQSYATKTVKLSKETKEFLYGKAHLSGIMAKAVEFEEVAEHPLLDLFKQVNPWMSRYELWEQTMLWLEVTGNAYWYMPTASAGSATTPPDQLWVLPASKMKIVPDQQNFIKGYIYENGTVKTPYEPYEILHLKYSSLDSVYYGMSPLAAVTFPVAINNSINQFEQSLMKNMARPEGTLTTDLSLDEEEFNRLKKDWSDNYGGANKVGKTVILEKGLKYTPITFSPRELQYLQGRKWNREEICAAYGIPLSKVTTEAVNLANANAGERQYGADTVLPRTTRIEEKLNEESFIGRYGTNMFVAFDNPVPADKEFELRERVANLGSYVTSVNEERQKIGMEEVDWGERPLTQAGIAPLPTEEERKAQQEQAAAAAQPPALEEGDAETLDDQWSDELDTADTEDEELKMLVDRFEEMFEDRLVAKHKGGKSNVLPLPFKQLNSGRG